MEEKDNRMGFCLPGLSKKKIFLLVWSLQTIGIKGITIEEWNWSGNPAEKWRTSKTNNNDDIKGDKVETHLRGVLQTARSLIAKESQPKDRSCVSDDGEVGVSWSGKEGEGSSLMAWVTGGSFCCSDSCKEASQRSATEISQGSAISEERIVSGYATCICGPCSKRPLEKEDNNDTCVSDGGRIDFGFFLKVGEYSTETFGAADSGNFCCSKKCVDPIGGSALTLVPIEDKNGELILGKDGEPVYEKWGDRFQNCLC